MAENNAAKEPIQHVWVAVDCTSRWFELFQNEEDAQRRANELNEKYRTIRYSIAKVTVS